MQTLSLVSKKRKKEFSEDQLTKHPSDYQCLNENRIKEPPKLQKKNRIVYINRGKILKSRRKLFAEEIFNKNIVS